MDLGRILGIGGESMVIKKKLKSGEFALKIIPYENQAYCDTKSGKAFNLIKHHINDEQFERVSNRGKY